MVKKILVTGGLGFIGHQVCKLFEKKNKDICLVDCLTNYQQLDIDALQALHQSRIKLLKTKNKFDVDVADAELMNQIFQQEKPDTVVHLASFPRQKTVEKSPVYAGQTMIAGLLNTLELSKNHGVKRFVFISSSMVYGNFDHDVPEDAPKNPIGAYGIMKLAGEHLVEDYCNKSDMEYVILRPSAVYGPLDMNDRVVAQFLINSIQDKTLTVNGVNESCDFTYIDDVAKGIVDATLSKNTSNCTYNLSRGNSRTLLEAAELAVKIARGGTVELAEKDANMPSRGALCIDRAQVDFNFKPKTDIEQGFKKYHAWLKNSI